MEDRGRELPMVVLRGAVLLPHTPQPLALGFPGSAELLAWLSAHPGDVFVVTQREPPKEALTVGALEEIGTVAVIHPVHMTEEPPPFPVVIAHGARRARLCELVETRPFPRCRVEELDDVQPGEGDAEYRALQSNIVSLFAQVVADSPHLPNELINAAASIEPFPARADFCAGVLPFLTAEVRQRLLTELDVRRRLRLVLEELMKERENQALQYKIRAEIQKKVAGSQREFYLHEQLKAIRHELGEVDETERTVANLEKRVSAAGLPEEAATQARTELERLREIPTASAEYAVVRTYVELLASLPWSVSTATPVDLARAAAVLDEDHHDLEKVKERILEFLAVLRLKADNKGPILCFVGPPGVGKTSVGQSIARALGRRFVRISLGGIQDEAEIRGHRRTYVAALPGQILQGIKRAGSNDPVFMLDEIDKLGKDFRGDPAAALLEVLDPEQNKAFRDHYLEVAFDLSHVLFITTANVLDPVPPALRDRMEVVELAGYTEEEKLEIARRFLVPRQCGACGLVEGTDVTFTEAALREVIRRYTREAGVRSLERQIGSVCRKHARRIASGTRTRLEVTAEVVRELLRVPPYWIETELEDRVRRPGVAVGLAWTPAGGEILFIEAARTRAERSTLTVTGQVGETMQESARAALTWLKSNAAGLGLDARAFHRQDVHIHVPAGAVPKDGPSAGLAIAAALASLFLDRPLKPLVALTGEVTLSGRVLPVGGIKEKVLGAKRAGVRTLILPEANRANALEELAPELRSGLTLHFVASIPQALALVLLDEHGLRRGAGPPEEAAAP